jgi:hypothetical protein
MCAGSQYSERQVMAFLARQSEDFLGDGILLELHDKRSFQICNAVIDFCVKRNIDLYAMIPTGKALQGMQWWESAWWLVQSTRRQK